MGSNELARTAKELMELKRMREEIDIEIDALEDQIKAYLGETEEVIAGSFKISWKQVTSTRFDMAAFRKALPEIAERFMKQTTTRRFCVR